MFSNELWQQSGVSTYSIDQSIRFVRTSNTAGGYMYKTPSSAGDRTSWTWSCWFKLGELNNFTPASNLYYALFSVDNATNDDNRGTLQIIADSGVASAIQFQFLGHSTIFLKTNRQFRDPNAWMHLVLTWDSDNGTPADRARLYINGVRETSFATSNITSITSGQEIGINLNAEHRIGGTKNISSGALNYPWDGYMADIVFLDGTSTDCTSFGEFNDSNIWIPKNVSGLSFGTNGFYINGSDASGTPVKLGDDQAGSNNYTTDGFTSADQVGDTPTNNHGVFNVLEKNLRYSTTLSNANKTIAFTSGSTGWSGTKLGLYRSNGKAYAEFKVNQAYSFVNGDGITVFVANDSNDSVSAGGGTGSAKLEAAYNAVDGSIYDGTSSQGTGTTWNTVNAVIGVYIDFDNGKGWFSKDGTVQTVNGTPNVETGANPHFTFTANSTLTVGAGGVHYATNGIVTLQNYAGEWATTPTSYTAFSTKAEGEA